MIAVEPRPSNRALLAVGIALAGFILLYWHVMYQLGMAWYTDDNYSHGFLIVPLALYFAWERRHKLFEAPIKPSVFGLVVVVGSILVLLAGLLGAELFLTRISLLGTLVGFVLFLGGWRTLRVLAFPLGFMLLMIPIPAIIFNQIAFPLQLLASRAGEYAMTVADVPVLREGNVLVLANTTLEVAEACSGIRSLISLLTLGIVLGHFADQRTWARVVIALATIPVAILANGLRIAGTGIAAAYFGAQAAEGFFHTFSGWLVFVFAFAMLLAIQRNIAWLVPGNPERASASTEVSAR